MVGAASIVALFSFLSRIVGLIRDRILLGHFGAGSELDAYYAAFKVPDLVFSLLVIGSLSATFIPIFTGHYFGVMSREKAWKFASNTLNILVIAMIALSVIVAIFARPFAALIAPGFDGVQQTLVADMTRIMLFAQIFLAISVVFGSMLQSLKRFLLFSLAPIFYNVGIIIGGLWFTEVFGTIGLAWGVVLGAFLHMLVQLYGALDAGYRWKPILHVTDKDTKEMLRLTGPRMLGIAVNQINFVVLTIIATTLAVGSVTVFQIAYNIQFFAVGIIGVSYAIAVFPQFVEEIERHDFTKFISTFSHAVRHVLFFMIPLTIVFLVLRAQIVRVVAGAGDFDWASTIRTANTLAFFTFSFVTQSLSLILARVFFAFRDTTTPLIAGLVSALLSLMSALWLSGIFGVMGLAMAFSIASIVHVVLLWFPLRQRIGSLDELRILKSIYIMISAGLGCAVVTQFLKPIIVSVIPLDTFVGVLSQGLIAGGAGLMVYTLICHLFRSEELQEIIAGAKRRVLKSSSPKETMTSESI